MAAMDSDELIGSAGATPHRQPYRPPVGLPLEQQGRLGAAISLVLHALIALLLVAPALISGAQVELPGGAGGPGPVGGGGGGRRGTGGDRVQERLRYLRVSQPVPKPAAAEVVEPPVLEEPEPKPPEPIPEPVPPAEPVAPQPTTQSDTMASASVTTGQGGGSGDDGTSGSGPGSGGGVGSGVGTGRGAGVGPGTGGGDSEIHPPRTAVIFIPPVPVPDRIRPYRVVAVFDVDSTGRVLSFTFNESADRDYNRKLRAVLSELRWRPAVRRDGTPVRAKAPFEYTIY
jgi:hypothetical protein